MIMDPVVSCNVLHNYYIKRDEEGRKHWILLIFFSF